MPTEEQMPVQGQEQMGAQEQIPLQEQGQQMAEMTPEQQMYYGGQIGLPKIKILSEGGLAGFKETKERIDGQLEDLYPEGIDKEYLSKVNLDDLKNTKGYPNIAHKKLNMENGDITIPTEPTVNKQNQPIDPETSLPLVLKNGRYEPSAAGSSQTDEDTLPGGYNSKLAMVGTLANALPGIHNVYRGLKKTAPINLERAKLSKIDLGRQRQLVKDASADAVKMNTENIRRTAPSSGAALSALASTSAAINSNTSRAIAESKLSEETTNIGIDNQQNAANAATANQEQDLRWRTDAAKQQVLEAGLNTIGSAGAMGVNDYNKFKANERYNERIARILETGDRRYNKNTGKTEYKKDGQKTETIDK